MSINLKSNMKILVMALLVMAIIFTFPVIANADSGKLSLFVTDASDVETKYVLDGGDTYPGVSYDFGTNTLTFTNANLGDAVLFYTGTTDLTIKLVGDSYMKHADKYGSGIIMSERTEQAALTIEGPGSLTMTNYLYEGISQRDDYYEEDPVDGNITIDGARLNFNGSSGIMSNYSDVIIKNGSSIYIDGSDNQGTYGIITGRTKGTFDRTGKLEISNSDIVIKNCSTTVSYNRLVADGVYFYAGKTGAEYELDMEENPSYRETLYDYGYFCASSTQKDVDKDAGADDAVTDGTETISNVTLSDDSLAYNGKVQKPKVVAYNSAGKKLIAGTDFEVDYIGDCKLPGHYDVEVYFKGDYTGEEYLHFIIYPKKCSNVTAKLRVRAGGYNDVNFDWNASYGADGYMVYYKKSTANKWNGPIKVKSKTYYYKNDLAGGVEYQFKVVPYFSDGEPWYDSDQAAIAKVTTLKKVVLKSFNRNSGKVKVQWKDIKGETGYQISKSAKKNGTYIVCKNVKANKASMLVKATKGKNYYYKVRAYKNVKVGNTIKKVYGPWSAPKKFRR